MFLKKIDFLSPEMTLFYKGSLSHSSTFSGILSIITCLIILTCTGYYFKGTIAREKDCPKIAYNHLFTEDAGIFPINSSSFFHFISIVKDKNFPDKEEFDFTTFNLIGLETNIQDYENDNDLKKYNHWLYGFCDNEIDSKGIKDLITQNYFTKSACIKKYFDSNSQKYYETGDINFRWPLLAHGTFNPKNEFYSVILQKCEQNILNNIFGKEYKCKNDTEIEEIIKNSGSIHFNFIDHFVDVLRYKEPIKKYFYRIENILDKENYSLNNLNFCPILVKTQNGIIWNNYEKKSTYSYERNDVFMHLNKGNIYMGYSLWINNKMYYYERIYRKISDVLSDIGGVSNSIIMIACFINKFINQFIILKDIQSVLNSSNVSINEIMNQCKNNNIKKSNTYSYQGNKEQIPINQNSIDKDRTDISSRTNIEIIGNNNKNSNKNKIKEKHYNFENNNKYCDKGKITESKNEPICFKNYLIYKLTLGKKDNNIMIYENFREKIISVENLIQNNLNISNLLKEKNNKT